MHNNGKSMSWKMYAPWLAVVLTLMVGPVQAAITLPQVLADNMVLQRHKPLPIWGQAAPGEQVTVAFGRQHKQATADASGHWQVVLDPLPASATPAVMTLAGENRITLHNILVGEVWLCSGQSNMEYTMNKSAKHAAAARSQGLHAEDFKKVKNPSLRVFLVRRDLRKPGQLNKGWQQAGYENLKDFSAAAYHFGEKLAQELGVPLGLISAAVPGSRIEPWIAAEVFAPVFQTQLAASLAGAEPGKHYDGMVAPLAPFALRGFLWYQGESNCFLNETTSYTEKMRLLIMSWRRAFKGQELAFHFVQLAPFYYSRSTGGDQAHTVETLPAFREAQAAVLDMPHTGMVVTTDLVDNPEDIHPAYKWEIGRRLALVALHKTYGRKKVMASGPAFKSLKIRQNQVELSFDHAGGLLSRDGKPLDGFTVAGDDGRFVPAQAVIKGGKVIVSAPDVALPLAVRFAWHEAAQPNLFNKAGLPAVPFRTDRLPLQPDLGHIPQPEKK
jgi:sialate O-acetylesterase